MNYRHAFHAGNHADVLKHVVLLGLVAALSRKDGALFALDTHAGRGAYPLDADAARRTGEADAGVRRLLNAGPTRDPAIDRYIAAVKAAGMSGTHPSYPGSPLLLARALRPQDRLACCELQPEEAGELRGLLRADGRVGVHQRDGYEGLAALLPPREKRGLVLIDPPYEAQLAEFDAVFPRLREALERWPQGVYALWYPIKLGRSLAPMYRRAADLPARGVLRIELCVRPDDSPLRMNGSGMLVVNPPWQYEHEIARALPGLLAALDEGGGHWRVDWLREAT